MATLPRVLGGFKTLVAALALTGGAPGAPAPPTLYVAPTGSDSGQCALVDPCATFGRAYQLAAAGEHVVVAEGDYGQQTVRAATTAKASSAPVVFEPAPGAAVTVSDQLDVYASDIEFDDMTTNVWYVHTGVSHATFRSIRTQLFFIRSASNVRVIGGSAGGVDDGGSPTLGSASATTPPAQQILIDHVAFHDVTRDAAPSAHVQCLFVQAVDGLTIQNSTFQRCGIMDLYINNIFQGGVPRNVLIQNNLFDRTVDGGYYSIYLRNDPGDVIDGFVLRYNSFLQGPHFDRGSYTNSRVVANVSPFSQNQCVDGLVFAHNLFDAARCSPTDRRAPLGFVDPATFHLGLRRGTAGIDAGDRKDAPRLDFNGRRRPRGKAPDAGAYENR